MPLNHVFETLTAIFEHHVLDILAIFIPAIVHVKHLHTVLAISYLFQNLELTRDEFARLCCPFNCHFSLVNCIKSFNNIP